MSLPTISEKLFEAHCETRLVRFRRIPPSTEQGVRKPDYELLLCPGSIIVDVKQIDANENDLAPELLARCQEEGMGLAPVERVRGMIESCYGQLRPYSKQGFPCMLVTYNYAGLVNYIDEHTVSKSLF